MPSKPSAKRVAERAVTFSEAAEPEPVQEQEQESESDEESPDEQYYDGDESISHLRTHNILSMKILFDRTVEMLKGRTPSYATDLLRPSVIPALSDTTMTRKEVADSFEAMVIASADSTIVGAVKSAFPHETVPLRVLLSQCIPRGMRGEYCLILFAERGTVRGGAKSQHKVAKKQVSTELLTKFLTALSTFKAEGRNVTEVILITPVPIQLEKTGYAGLIQQNIFVQVFRDAEIMTPVSTASLASQYRIIERNAVFEFLKMQGLEGRLGTLPAVHNDDPALKYIGAHPQQLVVITRPPIHAGETVLGGVSVKRVVAGLLS